MLTSSATTAGTATRRARTSARRAARRSSAAREDTHDHVPAVDAAPDAPGRRRGRRRPRRAARRRRRAGRASGARKPASTLRCSTRPSPRLGRHPDSDIFLDDITVSRRHAEIAARRRRLRGARRRLAQRHLRQPRAGRGGRRCATATSCRSASSSSCSSPAPATRDAPMADRAYLSIGEVLEPPAGGVPRRHHLQDPLPREPGPARPRAHAVGLPQVLRRRHRAPALDPPPAARALPAAQGDQGPFGEDALVGESAPEGYDAGDEAREGSNGDRSGDQSESESARRGRHDRTDLDGRSRPSGQTNQGQCRCVVGRCPGAAGECSLLGVTRVVAVGGREANRSAGQRGRRRERRPARTEPPRRRRHDGEPQLRRAGQGRRPRAGDGARARAVRPHRRARRRATNCTTTPTR